MFYKFSKEIRFLKPLRCGNCGELIYPGSSVGISYGRNKDEIVIFHVNFNCLPAGNYYDGFWRKDGIISFYDKVEKC